MIAIFVLAQKSVTIAETVKKLLLESGFDSELLCSKKISCNSADENVKSVYSAIQERFRAKKDIVAILPMGIVVRAIEPTNKTVDPWVVCIEENGRYVIPVLNGHRGANEFATLIAEAISAQVVITTSEEP
jgi:cobalamin biosynthesis protein CbiG